MRCLGNMFKQLGLKFIVCFLVLLIAMGLSPSAFASIHTYPETDAQTLYRSRLSVQDDHNQAWQLILFKRVNSGQVTEFKLRLVGFPGQVSMQHPAPLELRDRDDHLWMASDQTQDDPQLQTVQASVGQFDVLNVMTMLDRAQRLELTLTLEGAEHRLLIVPQSMVREWLNLKEI